MDQRAKAASSGRTTMTWLASLQQRHADALLTVMTILLIALLFIFVPLHAAGVPGSQILSSIGVLAVCACALLASGNLVAFFTMAVGVAINLLVLLLRITAPSRFDIILLGIAWLSIAGPLIFVTAKLVFRPGRITYHHVVGAVLVYLLIALIFVAIFAILGTLVPNAFQGLKVEDSPTLASVLVYFSFVTLTSTGYGDIVPLHPLARSLCNLETIFGQLYPATVLARLVTLELESRMK